jgi:hypothetical protein
MAQLLIVMGSLVTLGGAAGLFFVDLSETSRRGIPMWILMPAVVLSGLLIVGSGIRMWRRNGPSSPKNPPADENGNEPPTRATRIGRALPTTYFAGTGALGAGGVLAGLVTLVIGLASGDSGLTSTGVLVGGAGAVLSLVGWSAAAYMNSVKQPHNG